VNNVPAPIPICSPWDSVTFREPMPFFNSLLEVELSRASRRISVAGEDVRLQRRGDEGSPRDRRRGIAAQYSQASIHRDLAPCGIAPRPFAHQDAASLACVDDDLILTIASEPDRDRSGEFGVSGT
jgi:hypothetical protein